MLISLLATAGKNFWRGGMFTLATVLITVVALFSLVIAFSINLLWQEASATLASKLDISAEISEQANPVSFDQLLNELRSNPAVTVDSIRFISKDDALLNFRRRYQHRPEILAFLGAVGNPLYPSLTVTPVSLEKRGEVKSILNKPEYLGKVVIEIKEDPLQQEQLAELNKLTGRANQVVLTLGAIFFLITILIIANAIRLSIITRKEEIHLMQLVGASPNFIKGPLLLEGMLYGLAATILIAILLIPAFSLLPTDFCAYFGFPPPNFTLFWQRFLLPLLGWLFPVALLTGFLASSISVRRYL